MKLIINTTSGSINSTVDTHEEALDLIRVMRESGSIIESAFIGKSIDMQKLMI